MKSTIALLGVLLLSCNARAVPSLFTVIEGSERQLDFPVCQQRDVLTCNLVEVNRQLLESEAQQISFPDGHVLSRGQWIDVSDTAHGISYAVSTSL